VSDVSRLESLFSEEALAMAHSGLTGYIFENENIRVYCQDAIQCFYNVSPELQHDHVFFEGSNTYQRYKPTYIQYEIKSPTRLQKLDIEISFTNKLKTTEAKYAKICRHDGISQWHILDTTVDLERQVIKATSDQTGMFAVFLNDYWYSQYTQRIADEFPIWTYIRKSNESNGQRFLNWFGMQFEEARDTIDDIKNQKYIDLLNPKMLDWIYVYEIPKIKPTDDFSFYEGTKEIPIFSTLNEFLFNTREDGGIIDYQNQRLYTLGFHKNLKLEVRNIDNRMSVDLKGLPHHVWNAFDEFALLVGVERIYSIQETNESLRERIKDVFRYPANSGDLGLTHALGRELNLIKRVVWKDDTKNLYIKGKGMDPRTLLVDGRRLQSQEFSVDEFGHIIVYAMNQGKSHTVSIIKGIQKHELYDKQSEELHRLMFNDDGQASDRLLKWVEYINQVAPVMWGRFNWDEGYWDTINKDLTGLGYIPNMWDSNIEVWKAYTFKKNTGGQKIWQS
jgi:hypothetical protein